MLIKTLLRRFNPFKNKWPSLFEYSRFGANRLPRWEPYGGRALFERGRVVSATLPRRFLIGGIMEEKLQEIYNCLKVMDMMLYNYTCDPPRGVIPFKSTQEMAKYFRAMLHTTLPKEYQYKEKYDKENM